MSLIFLIGFLLTMAGKIPTEEFTSECFIVWALFSIADALWVRGNGK